MEPEKASKKTCYRLHYWEEAIGTLEKIWIEEGSLSAKIGKIVVILSTELEGTLYPLIGQRIAIIRTDIAGKEYLCRVIPEIGETVPMTAQSHCRDEQMPITVR